MSVCTSTDIAVTHHSSIYIAAKDKIKVGCSTGTPNSENRETFGVTSVFELYNQHTTLSSIVHQQLLGRVVNYIASSAVRQLYRSKQQQIENYIASSVRQ